MDLTTVYKKSTAVVSSVVQATAVCTPQHCDSSENIILLCAQILFHNFATTMLKNVISYTSEYLLLSYYKVLLQSKFPVASHFLRMRIASHAAQFSSHAMRIA